MQLNHSVGRGQPHFRDLLEYYPLCTCMVPSICHDPKPGAHELRVVTNLYNNTFINQINLHNKNFRAFT